jgi:hypothetical protein
MNLTDGFFSSVFGTGRWLWTIILTAALLLIISSSAETRGHDQGPLGKQEQQNFEAGDEIRISFESDVDSNLDIEFWDRQTAQFSWTIEADVEPTASKDRIGDLSGVLKVSAERDGGVVSVRVMSESGRFTSVRRSSKTGDVWYLHDVVTGILWKVKINAKLPRTAFIDSTRFQGLTNFPQEGGTTR